MKVLGSYTKGLSMFDVNQLMIEINTFFLEYNKYVHGNKISGRRARKASIKIEKLLLDYRLESLNKI